jgi:hypothetical protein
MNVKPERSTVSGAMHEDEYEPPDEHAAVSDRRMRRVVSRLASYAGMRPWREKAVLVSIVFIENLLGLWVLSNFIRTNNWFLALSYSSGAAAGALLVAITAKEPHTQSRLHKPQTSQPIHPFARDSATIPAVRRQTRRRRPSIYARGRHAAKPSAQQSWSRRRRNSLPRPFTPRPSQDADPLQPEPP